MFKMIQILVVFLCVESFSLQSSLDKSPEQSLVDTFFHSISAWNNPETIKKILESADTQTLKNLKDPNNNTIAHAIAKNANIELLEILFSKMTDTYSWINKQNALGETPLIASLTPFKNEKIVLALLNHDADANILDKTGASALTYAAAKAPPRIVDTMIKNYHAMINLPKESPLISAVIAGKNDNAQLLLKLGANPNAVWNNQSALYIALNQYKLSRYNSQEKQQEILNLLQQLITDGADLDQKLTGLQTPREFAKKLGLSDNLTSLAADMRNFAQDLVVVTVHMSP